MNKSDKYQAVIRNDESFDGVFYYGVLSTGIFCRPSCKSKAPLEKNVVFFATKEEAMNEGFRPCKRCRSDLEIYEPIKDVAYQVKDLIDEDFSSGSLKSKMSMIGLSTQRINTIFKDEFGVTPKEYLNQLRENEVRRLLIETDESVLNIAYKVGFNSLSPFYKFFSEFEERSPMEYRNMNKKKNYHIKETSLGNIRVDYKDDSVIGIQFVKELGGEGTLLTEEVFSQLEEYFKGLRTEFTFKYELIGTEFQKTVWNALKHVGYGETVSYGELANLIGRPTASRAVGMALGKNPILVVVPCHRIVGRTGKITGYAGGIDKKEQLLNIEK